MWIWFMSCKYSCIVTVMEPRALQKSSYLAITGHIVSLCTISGHLSTYQAPWSQYDQTWPKVPKWFKKGNAEKYSPNLSYLDTLTNIGPLYATSHQIWPILYQSAIHAITWYTRPRFLNSALKWTNSFKLDILNHRWPPLPKRVIRNH